MDFPWLGSIRARKFRPSSSEEEEEEEEEEAEDVVEEETAEGSASAARQVSPSHGDPEWIRELEDDDDGIDPFVKLTRPYRKHTKEAYQLQP